MSTEPKIVHKESKPSLGEAAPQIAPPPYRQVGEVQSTSNPTTDIIEPITIPRPAHTVDQDKSDSKPVGGIQNEARNGITNYVVPLERLAQKPEWIDCPYCKQRTQTKVTENESSATGLAALGCCLFCGIITVCLPYLMKCFYDTDHHCSVCGKHVVHLPHDGQAQPIYPAPDLVQPSKYAIMTDEQKMRLQAT